MYTLLTSAKKITTPDDATLATEYKQLGHFNETQTGNVYFICLALLNYYVGLSSKFELGWMEPNKKHWRESGIKITWTDNFFSS